MPELRDAVNAWMTAAEWVAPALLRALAGLGQSEHYFDAQFADSPCRISKISRYPGRAVAEAAGSAPYRDYGRLTVLLQDQIGGLQFTTKEGHPVDVTPLPHGLDAVIGQMLKFVSRGILRALVHYVRNPEPEEDHISVSFFYNPQLNAALREMPIPAELLGSAALGGDPADPSSIDYGYHILRGYLRLHPEVACRHWGSYEH